MRTKELFNFVHARYKVWVNRCAGNPKPWTSDPILQKYRFCNVYREYDTVTGWIADHWRTPHQTDKNLWFNLVIARLINNPSTLADLGYSDSWNRNRFVKIMERRQGAGLRNFNPAYIVSTNGMAVPKHIYLADEVITPLWKARAYTRPHTTECFDLWYQALIEFNGIGSFLAGQIIADLKYAEPYLSVPDWWTFAASGPGSRRGMNRIHNKPVNRSYPEDLWYGDLARLATDVNVFIENAGMPRMHAQDLQNCLCEFDKYERVRLGEGTPKQRYNGGGE